MDKNSNLLKGDYFIYGKEVSVFYVSAADRAAADRFDVRHPEQGIFFYHI